MDCNEIAHLLYNSDVDSGSTSEFNEDISEFNWIYDEDYRNLYENIPTSSDIESDDGMTGNKWTDDF